ncbi:6-phosphogluconolactonase [Cyanobium sp. Alchichica 3B3-8F6]|uniref:6-phosphogluconolactonase n=1 Tax=Cyanobium sp. Alchichica 3B3-8F6 TaxID=2823696 RepID=UPI0020CEFC5F|nr:6-phosphogluconolactonase [Cyanobium sp. Alchichica 3B3-8F6]MCP9882167.1 6-phosphogluconolactonase [Cyanobium sp. Alchichica 3B3-8F6]
MQSHPPSSSNSPTRYRLIVAESAEDLARQTAQAIASALDLVLAERDRAQIALAGGETPRATYRQLGQQHLPWDRVDVLLGDERWVSSSDPSSNARMLRETLMAEAPGSHACLHPVPTELSSPQEGAEAYAGLVQQLCGGTPPALDLVLLGLGDDGHTASLFPGTAAPTITDRAVTLGEGKGLPRVTLTAPTLSAARQVLFLVSGAGKVQALQRLLDPLESPERTPAKLVQPADEVMILADRDAAAGLQR